MEKYLRHYAEPEINSLDGLLEALPGQQPWSNVLVIPACNEAPRFLRPPPPCKRRSLLILVINEPVSSSPEVSANNRALATAVRAKFESHGRIDGGSPESSAGYGMELLRDPASPRDILLVDRFSAGRKLPARGGVGHARKVGADLAAALIHLKRIHSSWIHCSDADVMLPDTYFHCSNRSRYADTDYAALVYPFRHAGAGDGTDQEAVILATELYELSLHYYVAGMKFAGSPYAFHTIGSTMAVNALHYAKVRGFPRREAGEDFYLLNKLAKVGTVVEMQEGSNCEAIRIEARRSDRVPFGTGAAVNTISGLADPVTDFRFYNPAVFELLKAWLASWPAIWKSGSSDFSAVILQQSSRDRVQSDKRQLLVAGLEKAGASQALEHAFRQSSDTEQFTRQMQTWFDAFRTLKLIHFLRDHGLTSIARDELAKNSLGIEALRRQGLERLAGQ